MLMVCLHLVSRTMRVTSETPAEMRTVAAKGADVECMSTVLEALSLAGTGLRYLGAAVVANRGRQSGDHTRRCVLGPSTIGSKLLAGCFGPHRPRIWLRVLSTGPMSQEARNILRISPGRKGTMPIMRRA